MKITEEMDKTFNAFFKILPFLLINLLIFLNVTKKKV